MSEIAIVLGRLQKGKSTLAAHLATQAHRAVLIFDPGETFENGTVVESGDGMWEAIQDDAKAPIVLRSEWPDQDITEFVTVALCCRDCSIVVDEVSFLMSPHQIHPALSKLIRRGPKVAKDRDLFFTSHRVSDLHGVALGLAHKVYFFETNYNKDLERIREFCSDQAAERVAKLEGRQWLCFDRVSKTFFVNNSPESWHLPLARKLKEKTSLDAPPYVEEIPAL